MTFDARLVGGGRPSAEGDREFVCERCGARCTRGPDGTEYGHQYGCPGRPADLPRGGGNSPCSYHGGREGSA